MSGEYNGWANWNTWNVALWIGNDEGLYHMAKEAGNYKAFCEYLREVGNGSIAFETPDKVAWNDSGLDTERLDRMIQEL